MHEMSIAVEIVHSVLDAVAEHHPAQIDEIEVRIGVMRQVVPEAQIAGSRGSQTITMPQEWWFAIAGLPDRPVSGGGKMTA